jgi:hypothetical protein
MFTIGVHNTFNENGKFKRDEMMCYKNMDVIQKWVIDYAQLAQKSRRQASSLELKLK